MSRWFNLIFYLQALMLSQGGVRVTVTITDINDNAPYLGQTTHNVTEGVGLGLQAVDFDLRDADVDTTFSVNLLRAHRHGFAIGRQLLFDVDNTSFAMPASAIPGLPFRISTDQTGLVTTGEVDYETAYLYQLELSVVDQGGLRSNVTLEVLIINVNDNAPSFDRTEYDIRLSTALLADTVLVQLTATDPDGDGFTYAIDASRWEALPLAINSSDGTITLTQPLRNPSAVFVLAAERRRRALLQEPEVGQPLVIEVPVTATDAGDQSTGAILKVGLLSWHDACDLDLLTECHAMPHGMPTPLTMAVIS